MKGFSVLAALNAIIRKAWRGLNVFRRLTFFLLKGSTILLICVMLLFNVATLTISSVNAAVLGAIETLTGLSTVGSRQSAMLKKAEAKAATLDADLRRAKSDLSIERKKSAILAKKYGTVEVETRRLRSQGPDVTFRGKTRTLKSVAEEVTELVSRRTAKVAATNVGSMAGEGIPFWGIAVIVASTTLEIKAACDTMIDMSDLQKVLSPGSDIDDQASEVCGTRILTQDEIWEAVKSSPGKVWASSKEVFLDLPSPDFDDWWARALAQIGWE